MKHNDSLKRAYPNLLARCRFFSVPEGWADLVNSLLVDLNRILMENTICDGIFHLVDVEEKFGSLRVHVTGYPIEPVIVGSWGNEWRKTTDATDCTPPISEWYFEGFCGIDLEEGLDDAIGRRILAAVANAICLPEHVSQPIKQRIEQAKTQALKTCQLCGSPGRHIDGPVNLTLCSEHLSPDQRQQWRASCRTGSCR